MFDRGVLVLLKLCGATENERVGTTGSKLWIGNLNNKARKTIKHSILNSWCATQFCKMSAKRVHPMSKVPWMLNSFLELELQREERKIFKIWDFFWNVLFLIAENWWWNSVYLLYPVNQLFWYSQYVYLVISYQLYRIYLRCCILCLSFQNNNGVFLILYWISLINSISRTRISEASLKVTESFFVSPTHIGPFAKWLWFLTKNQ